MENKIMRSLVSIPLIGLSFSLNGDVEAKFSSTPLTCPDTPVKKQFLGLSGFVERAPIKDHLIRVSEDDFNAKTPIERVTNFGNLDDFIPFTSLDLAKKINAAISSADCTVHPFWARTLVNQKHESHDLIPMGYSDFKRTESNDGELDIFLVNPKDPRILSTDQVSWFLSQAPGGIDYGKLALVIYAHSTWLGGGTNDKGSIFAMNRAQEEQVFSCFPFIYDLIHSAKCVTPYLTEIKKASEGKETETLTPYWNNPDLAKTLSALPRYSYTLQLAPNPDTDKDAVSLNEASVLSFKPGLRFRSFYITGIPQCFVSTSDDIANVLHKRGKPLCGYNPIAPQNVDLIFTAAIKLEGFKKPIKTHISKEYFNLWVDTLTPQMAILVQTKSKTLITGNIGCGIFDNDPRIVALAYAFVLKTYKPATLEHVAIIDSNFFNKLRSVWDLAVAGNLDATYTNFLASGETTQLQRDPSMLRGKQLCPIDSPLADIFDTLPSIKNETQLEAFLRELPKRLTGIPEDTLTRFTNRKTQTLNEAIGSLQKSLQGK